MNFVWYTQTVAAGDTAVLHCSFDAIFSQLRNGNVSEECYILVVVVIVVVVLIVVVVVVVVVVIVVVVALVPVVLVNALARMHADSTHECHQNMAYKPSRGL